MFRPPNGTAWLSANPATGAVNPGSASFSIQADLSGLTAGVSTGTVAVSFDNGSSATIQVVAIVTSSTASHLGTGKPMALRPLDVAGCSGGKPGFLIPVIQQPLDQSAAQVSIPKTVQAQVIDDCGNAVTSARGGAVQVTFTNPQGASDAPLTLNEAGNGVWITTWTPVNVGPGISLRISASEGALSVSPSLVAALGISVNVQSAPSGSAAQVTGVINAAAGSAGTPSVVSPGSYVAIYGTGLSSPGVVSANSLPLGSTLNGTQLLLGGKPMPLLFASPGQVNALIPQSISPNTTLPLVVVRGSTQSVPVPLAIAGLQPGIYTVDQSGQGQDIVEIAGTSTIAGPAGTGQSPATRGSDYLVVFCTGLGAVRGPNGEAGPADGAAAPSDIVYQTTAKVTATIGGIDAPVVFAGLTPSLAGLYQVNIMLPANIPTGDRANLVLTVRDQ